MAKDKYDALTEYLRPLFSNINVVRAHNRLRDDIKKRKEADPYTTPAEVERLTRINEMDLRFLSALGLVPRFRFGTRVRYNMMALLVVLELFLPDAQ